MRLLFDENLAPGLARQIADLYPGSAHVHELGLGSVPDAAVWEHARAHEFTIVSKDADYHALSQLRGSPPKVIWIRRGNCSTSEIATPLRLHHSRVVPFLGDAATAILAIT